MKRDALTARPCGTGRLPVLLSDGDFFGSDEMVGVASTSGGDGGIERMIEGVAEGDAGWGGFNGFDGASALKHLGLGCHEEESNTESTEDTESNRGIPIGEKEKGGRCVRLLRNGRQD